MEEIAQQFKEELQELLDRYKDRLTNPQIMRVAQHIFYETLSPKKHPERFQGFDYAKGFPIIDELDKKMKRCNFEGIWKSEKEVRNIVYKDYCSPQEIAEASCDGDIRHCNNTCHKRSKHV